MSEDDRDRPRLDVEVVSVTPPRPRPARPSRRVPKWPLMPVVAVLAVVTATLWLSSHRSEPAGTAAPTTARLTAPTGLPQFRDSGLDLWFSTKEGFLAKLDLETGAVTTFDTISAGIQIYGLSGAVAVFDEDRGTDVYDLRGHRVAQGLGPGVAPLVPTDLSGFFVLTEGNGRRWAFVHPGGAVRVFDTLDIAALVPVALRGDGEIVGSRVAVPHGLESGRLALDANKWQSIGPGVVTDYVSDQAILSQCQVRCDIESVGLAPASGSRTLATSASSAKLSPDGSQLAVSRVESAGVEITVLDAGTGIPLWSTTGNYPATDANLSWAWSPRTDWLFLLDADGTITAWQHDGTVVRFGLPAITARGFAVTERP